MTVIDARRDVQELETYSGHFLNYLDPKVADIELADIARGLSQVCRFAGQTSQYYSVAEHAIYVSKLVAEIQHQEAVDEALRTGTRIYERGPELPLAALHHDSHEAYLGDWPSPLKHVFDSDLYRQIARDIDLSICVKFGIPLEALKDPRVKQADITAMRHEAATLKWSHGTGPHWGWDDAVRPLAGIGWSPAKAEREFLQRHEELCALR